MPLPLNTPIQGRIKEAFEKKFEAAKSNRSSSGSVISKGEWYEIFKRYNLFDVDDSPEITNEQRENVPEEDRNYQSDLIDAFIECLEDLFLGKFFDGVADTIQNLIDKSLVKAMSADGKINLLANSVSAIPVPGVQVVKVANDTTGSLISLAHGLPPFDIDIIPRFSFNLPSLPYDFSNLLPSGYIMPDWVFVRKQENARAKFYHSGKSSQGLILGVGIDFGQLDEKTLSKIFIVNSVDKFGKISGDILTGVDKDTYSKLKPLVGLTGNDAIDRLNDENVSNISLHEGQIMGTFVRYADISYWRPMSNPENWMHGHWGFITNNVCPSGLRTAIASYTYNHGAMIKQNQNTISAFISYCVQMGIFYKIGYEFPVAYTHLGKPATDGGFDDIDSTLTTTIDGTRYDIRYNSEGGGILNGEYLVNENSPVVVDRIPRNNSIANIYFTLASDLLSRRTYGSITDTTTSRILRKRRVDEANLVYSDVLGPDKIIEFGNPPSSFIYEQSIESMRERYFECLINGTVLRYDNITGPGTQSNGALPNENDALSNNGYSNTDYTEYYAPHISHEFTNTLKRIRFWNSALYNDFVVESEIIRGQ